MSDRKKVMVIFGTRPEAIKCASIIKELQAHPDIFETVICVTGQHREMIQPLLEFFDIVPDYDLDIMKPGQDLFDISIKILNGLRAVFKKEKPEIVLVQGDTSSGMIATLAAFYMKISVGHIEAGLRTYDKYSPWPEEINRKIIDDIADYHFAPTQDAYDVLVKEGFKSGRVAITGNTGIDALLKIAQHYEKNDKLTAKTRKVIVTVHRREIGSEEIQEICNTIKILARTYTNCHFTIPMHKNPAVRDIVSKLGDENLPNIHLTEPIDYVPFVKEMAEAYLIMTDSGGIQEEAPLLGVPVLVLRNVTERLEAVNLGTAKIVGTDPQLIIDEFTKLMEDPEHYKKMAKKHFVFGDGKAAERIVDILINHKPVKPSLAIK